MTLESLYYRQNVKTTPNKFFFQVAIIEIQTIFYNFWSFVSSTVNVFVNQVKPKEIFFRRIYILFLILNSAKILILHNSIYVVDFCTVYIMLRLVFLAHLSVIEVVPPTYYYHYYICKRYISPGLCVKSRSSENVKDITLTNEAQKDVKTIPITFQDLVNSVKPRMWVYCILHFLLLSKQYLAINTKLINVEYVKEC